MVKLKIVILKLLFRWR